MSTDSQEQQIWELLESNGKAWTPAPELARISLQYCRAVNALRKRYGRDAIENRVEWHGRVRHGFYRLKPKTERPTEKLSASKPPNQTPPSPTPAPAIDQQLFALGDLPARPDALVDVSRFEKARMYSQAKEEGRG